MSKRTLRNGTIVHKREGDAVPFVAEIQTNPGVDTLELLRPERAVERLEAENAALTREVEGLRTAAERAISILAGAPRIGERASAAMHQLQTALSATGRDTAGEGATDDKGR